MKVKMNINNFKTAADDDDTPMTGELISDTHGLAIIRNSSLE